MATIRLNSEQRLTSNQDHTKDFGYGYHPGSGLQASVFDAESPSSLQHEMKNRIVNLDAVLDIDAKIGAIEEPQHRLEVALEHGIRYAGCDRGSIWLYNAKLAELTLVCAQGPQTEFIPHTIPAYEGIAKRSLLDKRIQRIEKVQGDPDYQELYQQHRQGTLYGQFLRSFRSTLSAPLLYNNRPIGLFCAHSPWENDFSECHDALLEMLLHRIAWMLHHTQILDRTRQDAWRMASAVLNLANVGGSLSTMAEPEELQNEVYRLCAEKAMEVTSARVASLRLLDPDRECLWFAGVAGPGWTQEMKDKEYQLSEVTAARQAIETRAPYYADNSMIYMGL